MTTILLIWYCLGWINCALAFFIEPKISESFPVVLGFIAAPIVTPVLLLSLIAFGDPLIGLDPDRQYWWKREEG